MNPTVMNKMNGIANSFRWHTGWRDEQPDLKRDRRAAMRSPARSAVFKYRRNASVGSVKMNWCPAAASAAADHDERENAIDEKDRERDPDGERDERADQPLPELVEVFQKRHLAAGFTLVSLVPALAVVLVLRVGERNNGHAVQAPVLVSADWSASASGAVGAGVGMGGV